MEHGPLPRSILFYPKPDERRNIVRILITVDTTTAAATTTTGLLDELDALEQPHDFEDAENLPPAHTLFTGISSSGCGV